MFPGRLDSLVDYLVGSFYPVSAILLVAPLGAARGRAHDEGHGRATGGRLKRKERSPVQVTRIEASGKGKGERESPLESGDREREPVLADLNSQFSTFSSGQNPVPKHSLAGNPDLTPAQHHGDGDPEMTEQDKGGQLE